MIEIVIDNSICTIKGINRNQYNELRNILSYLPDAKQRIFSGNHFRKYLIDKKGNFPTGLLYLVAALYKKNKEKLIYTDKRKIPRQNNSIIANFKLPFAPYQEQKEAAEIALKEKRGIITAPTGMGKSLIAALIIEKVKVNTLVVVPTLALKEQVTATLQSVFGAQIVGKEGSPIFVENVDALKTKKQINYDCVIIDEFHHSGAKTYRKLNKLAWGSVYYKFGLTATPFRSKEEENILLESVLSKVIYKIEYSTAVKKNYISPIEAYYFDLPKLELPDDRNFTYQQLYDILIINRKDKNEVISEFLKNMKAANTSTLCLVKQIEHGNVLSEMTGIPFASGIEDNSYQYLQKFNRKEIPVLIGTHGVLGEGVDTKPCEFVFIAIPIKSQNLFMQCVGRALRAYPGKESGKVVIFREPSHKWFKEAFRTQCKILKQEYGVAPAKINS